MLAVISQYPHYLLFKNDNLNVCFTLLAGLFVLMLYDSKVTYFLKAPTLLGILVVSHILDFEYGIYGIATIVIFYICDRKYYLIPMQSIITIFAIILYRYYPVQIISILSILIITSLEKFDFRINKILYYSFYPAHIILLLKLTYVFPR